jgi:hypothetical protein
LRVGEPRDEEFRKPENNELLLATHVERRQSELTARKKALEAERESLIRESKRRYHEIEVAVWALEGGSDIGAIAIEVRELHEIETLLGSIEQRVNELRRTRPDWSVRGRSAQVPLAKMENAKRAGEKRSDLLREEQAVLARVIEQAEWLRQAEKLFESARRVAMLRQQLDRFPSKATLDARLEEATETRKQALQRLNEIAAELTEAKKLLDRARAVGAIRRALSGLPNPEKQAHEVERLEEERKYPEQGIQTAEQKLEKARQEHAEVENLMAQITTFGDVPLVEAAEASVAQRELQLDQSQRRLKEIHTSLNTLSWQMKDSQAEAEAFFGEYHATPEEIAETSRRNEEELNALESEHRKRPEERLNSEKTVGEVLQNHIEELGRWRNRTGND